MNWALNSQIPKMYHQKLKDRMIERLGYAGLNPLDILCILEDKGLLF